MKINLYKELAEIKGLTTYHYKVILYLFGCKEVTQSEMSVAFGVSKQNINRVFKDLISMDIIVKSKTEGRNIFWKLNPSPKLQIKGQMNMDNII